MSAVRNLDKVSGSGWEKKWYVLLLPRLTTRTHPANTGDALLHVVVRGGEPHSAAPLLNTAAPVDEAHKDREEPQQDCGAPENDTLPNIGVVVHRAKVRTKHLF